MTVDPREERPAGLDGQEADPLIGTIVSERYEILERVGFGGMSVVYKARHILMDRMVAMKMLRSQLVANPQSLARFRQEAQAVSLLDHPHIVSVFDFGVSSAGQPYLVMDFLQGQSLADLIKSQKRVPLEKALPIFAQSCAALEHAHKMGVIHRDIKPSNIMLRETEGETTFVRILDFGIAKLLPQSGKEVMELTQTGDVFGSPLYMSPEQCMGHPLDARSDVFSLGCVMYEALTGVPPFMGENMLDTMYRRVSEDARPFKSFDPPLALAPEVEAIVMKAVERVPADRFSSMAALGEAVELYIRGDLAAVRERTQSGAKRGSRGIWGGRASKSQKLVFQAFALMALFFVAWNFMGLRGFVYTAMTVNQERRFTLLAQEGERQLSRKNAKAAEVAFNRALGEAERFGPLDRRVMTALRGLRSAYQLEGKFIELDRVNERIAHLQQEKLAEDFGEDADLANLVEATLASVPADPAKMGTAQADEAIDRLASLARFCLDQGDAARAERLYDKALEVDRSVAGSATPRACWLLSSLANVFLEQGHLDRAEALLTQALAESEKLAGKDHPYVASNLNSLGRLYAALGDLERATGFHRRAVTLVEADDHYEKHRKAGFMRDYASVLRKGNRLDEAVALEARVGRLEKAVPRSRP